MKIKEVMKLTGLTRKAICIYTNFLTKTFLFSKNNRHNSKQQLPR